MPRAALRSAAAALRQSRQSGIHEQALKAPACSKHGGSCGWGLAKKKGLKQSWGHRLRHQLFSSAALIHPTAQRPSFVVSLLSCCRPFYKYVSLSLPLVPPHPHHQVLTDSSASPSPPVSGPHVGIYLPLWADTPWLQNLPMEPETFVKTSFSHIVSCNKHYLLHSLVSPDCNSISALVTAFRETSTLKKYNRNLMFLDHTHHTHWQRGTNGFKYKRKGSLIRRRLNQCGMQRQEMWSETMDNRQINSDNTGSNKHKYKLQIKKADAER